MNQTIILVGMMGSGKSTVGHALASALGWEFIDADAAIEARAGVDIPLIFELEGEAGFRKRETRILKELVAKSGAVVSTGGGAVTQEVNRTLLKESGAAVIYLKIDAETAYKRTKGSNRPLLQTADPLATIGKLIAEREPFYSEVCTHTVDVSNSRVEESVREILSCANVCSDKEE